MAVAAGTIRRRRGDEEKKLAAKSKRDKVILAVGGVLLLAVLVFEVPKVLSSGSSSAPAPAPVAAAAPAAAVPGGAPSPELVRSDLRAIAKLPSKDPFQAQLGANTAVSTASQPFTHGPRVRASHFVVKDPFKVQIGAPANAAPAAPLATPPPVTSAKATHKTSTGTNASSGYIVILRSLDSKAAALQEVKKAHAKGLTSAAILYSSKYTTLRHGYWVVYLSKYATVAAANAGLQDASAHGYGSAYRRPVKK
jgi:SPOR domain